MSLSNKIINIVNNKEECTIEFPSTKKLVIKEKNKELPEALKNKYFGKRNFKIYHTPQQSKALVCFASGSLNNKERDLGVHLFSKYLK